MHLSVGARQTPLPQRIAGRDMFRYLQATGLMSKTADSRIGRRMQALAALAVVAARSPVGPGVLAVLGWVWPPLLLALVVWTGVQARHRPSGRMQPWLRYPVFGVLALAAAPDALRRQHALVAAALHGRRLGRGRDHRRRDRRGHALRVAAAVLVRAAPDPGRGAAFKRRADANCAVGHGASVVLDATPAPLRPSLCPDRDST